MSFVQEWSTVFNKSIQAFSGRNRLLDVREIDRVLDGSLPLVTSLEEVDKLFGLLDQNQGHGSNEERQWAKKYKDVVSEQESLKKVAKK